MSKSAKKSLFRYGLLSLVLFVSYIINVIPWSFSLWMAAPCLLIPFVVCVAMFEEFLPAAFFALAAGLLWDASSGYLFGYNAFFLIIIAVSVNLLVLNLVRVNLPSGILLSFAATALFLLIFFFFFYVLFSREGLLTVFLFSILPSIVLTVIFSPLSYLVVKAIEKRFSRDAA